MDERQEGSFVQAVEGLNQRGGRMLSLVDLILANTLSLDAAAYLAARVRQGASLLTAAVPGGAGKTTVMAALMGAIPVGESLITVADERALSRPCSGRGTWLVHEIQDAPYYGYLWGRPVAAYIDKARQGGRVVSCIHADDLPQLIGALTAPPNNVPFESLLGIDLIMFLRVIRGAGGVLRRVSSVFESTDGAHREVVRWNPEIDQHQRAEAGKGARQEVAACQVVLSRLVQDGVTDWSAVRWALAKEDRAADSCAC